jgi:surface polysaccharide O-acyltransferase-like enzyme
MERPIEGEQGKQRAPASRVSRIDAFRLFCMIGIIFAHAYFFGGAAHESRLERLAEVVGTQGVRFTMPFFFATAAYFYFPKIRRLPVDDFSAAKAYSRRLLEIFVFWSAFYGIEQPLVAKDRFLELHGLGDCARAIGDYWASLARDPLTLLFEGTAPHLWFLSALLASLWLFTILRRYGVSDVQFVAVASCLYIVGVLGGFYAKTPIGLNLHFETRDGPFFGALFFGIGAWFARRREVPSWSWTFILLVILVGVGLSAGELGFLHREYGFNMRDADYVFGTAPYGIGMMLAAYKPGETALERFMGRLGRSTLGIYVSHMFFVDLLRPLRVFLPALVWPVLLTGLVLVASLCFTWALEKTPLNRFIA